MTEKRFEFREVNNCGITPKVWDKDKQKYANLLECVDWLNDLHEENEQLKSSDTITDLETQIMKLKQENEQLKQQVEDLEFKLRTIKAYDRTVKEEHSDAVYDFKKKLEKW